MRARLDALIWRRADFRESSRLVTLFTRERGKLATLAKGAHRPTSPMLGRLDLLNRCQVTLTGRGLPLLTEARLVHEPRALREPRRFAIANYLIGALDTAAIEGRADPELFDLAAGAVTLLEHTPHAGLGVVLAGLELRLLRVLGVLAELTRCGQCGRELERAPLYLAQHHGGLFCARHRPAGARRADAAALSWLDRLGGTPGRLWPTLATPPALGRALALLGAWVADALEAPPRSRALAVAATRRR